MNVRLIRSRGPFPLPRWDQTPDSLDKRPVRRPKRCAAVRRERRLECLGFRIRWTEFQRLPNGAQRSCDILLAIQGQRKVELIIGIVGIGGHRLQEKGGGVQAPAARRDSLVVDYFREGQLPVNKREGVFRLDIAAQINTPVPDRSRLPGRWGRCAAIDPACWPPVQIAGWQNKICPEQTTPARSLGQCVPTLSGDGSVLQDRSPPSRGCSSQKRHL